jgi:hypothetical protein
MQTTIITRQQQEQSIQMMREAMRESIRRDKRAGRMTAQTIAKFAALHLTLDDGCTPVTPAAHHWLWMALACDENIKKLLIISQPEAAKTTWIVSGFLGCYLGFYPERNVIIGSVTKDVAVKRSLSLRTMVETPNWQSTFPNVLPIKANDGFKWTADEWSLAPGGKPRTGRLHPSMFAVGRGGDVIGSRADLVVSDDILDDDSTRTQHQRDGDERWMHSTFLARRKSRVGRIIIIGNAWHPEDYYAKAEREGGWVICKTRTLSEGREAWAELIYPDGWKHSMLGVPVGEAIV